MDLYTLIPRTLVGVVYPAFASLKAVLSGSADSSAAWLRYWVVLGVFSVVELLLDPVINPLIYSFPTYLVLKCLFLVWCMLPQWFNGSDIIFNQVLFPLFKTHHEQIEEQAEKAKLTIAEKLGDFFKSDKKVTSDKKDNGDKDKKEKTENRQSKIMDINFFKKDSAEKNDEKQN